MGTFNDDSKADPPGLLTPPAKAPRGAPSGESRLSNYFFVIGTIVLAVFVVTITSMHSLGSSFGGWGSNTASTVHLRTRDEPTAIEVKADKVVKREEPVDKTKPMEQHSWTENDFPDSEDDGRPSEKEKQKQSKASENDQPVVEEKKTEEKKTEKKRDKDENTVTEEEKKKDSQTEQKPSKPSSTTPSLLDAVVRAREELIKNLRKDYGDDHFEAIFGGSLDPESDTENGRAPTPETHKMEYLPIRSFGPHDFRFSAHFNEEKKKEYRQKTDPKNFYSVSNLRRKMMIKILTAKQNPSKNKYVWATGGHSASAGHGNVFSETYTKVMEAAASKVFNAAGLELDARAYGMGATSSAAEMSMCFKEVYGDDVDIFSWDFGMLEARDYMSARFLHYATRGFLSNQQVVPAFVALQEISQSRLDMMRELHESFREPDDDPTENNGLAMFVRDEESWKKMKEAFPDSAGLTGEEIEKLPKLVRHFKCDGAYEKGEPFCLDKKYTDGEICPKRRGKASWHPGWKYHALVGNSMALFLTEMLVKAVREIEVAINSDEGDDESLEELLSKLRREESTFRDKIFRARAPQLPKSFPTVYWYNNTSDNWNDYPEAETRGLAADFKEKWKSLDREALFRGPSICHTARVPAQTRFHGYLTNQPELTGKQTIFGKETYFTGVRESDYFALNKKNAEEKSTEPHDMQLVWVDGNGNERTKDCDDVLVAPDYHDFFMAEEGEGWTTLTFPNDAEKRAYGYDKNKNEYKGILVIVPRFCGFGKCEEGFLGYSEYNDGKWAMRVNGKVVTGMTIIGHEAIVLENEDGIIFHPSDDGRYHLELKVNEPKSFIKISAFVLY